MVTTAFDYKVEGANNIHLVGDFNEWDINTNPMEKTESGEFKLVLDLEPGQYNYKYLVDNKWHNDPASDEASNDESGNLNSIKNVKS